MWATISRNNDNRGGRRRRRGSVRFKIAATFTLFTALLLLILNIYPVLITRDVVMGSKQRTMLAQGLVISNSLAALDTLTGETVAQVMLLLDVTPMTRMLVTDPDGRILYDASEEEDAVGRYALLGEVSRAAGGRSVFSCRYAGGEFVSSAAVPVVSGGSVQGVVYLYERDTEQVEIMHGLQRNLGTMSLAFGGVGLVVIFLIAGTLTHRIKRLASAVGIVSSGDYAYRVNVRGRDEIADLSDKFNDLTGRLESTEEARRRFVSDASHELRTPLAAIRLLSDSITQSESMDVDTCREFAADIGGEAERLQRVTEKLMNLTRLDAGVSRRQREPVDVKQVVNRTLHLLAPLAAEQRVNIRTMLPEDGSCVVLASADDLYQIIFNLVENGIKYNRPEGTVALYLRRVGREAVLDVTDTGIGIPEADLPSIFDRFYRVDKARSRASGGSGLGLSIVREAVLANGGSIRVTRRPEGGTSFTVAFPVLKRRERP